jgi:nucleoside 2-deoxyribosyltransferase
MKIFLIVSRDGGTSKIEPKSIASILENQGNKVIISVVTDSAITGQEDPVKAYQKNLNQIKKCDFVVAESTASTSGLGFLLSAAVAEKKPVLALNNESVSKLPASQLMGFAAKNKLVSVRNYQKSTLDAVFTEFFGEVRKILDTKFILIISPEIDGYLQWASDNRRMHKAQVVRRAVEKVMNDDKEYKKFVNSLKRK